MAAADAGISLVRPGRGEGHRGGGVGGDDDTEFVAEAGEEFFDAHAKGGSGGGGKELGLGAHLGAGKSFDEFVDEGPDGVGFEVGEAGVGGGGGEEVEGGEGVRGGLAAETPEEAAVGRVAAVEDELRADEAGFEGEDAPTDGAEVGDAAFEDGLFYEAEPGVEVFGGDLDGIFPESGQEGGLEAVEFGGEAAEDLFGAEVGVEVAAWVEGSGDGFEGGGGGGVGWGGGGCRRGLGFFLGGGRGGLVLVAGG